jgi:hypothetical protein
MIRNHFRGIIRSAPLHLQRESTHHLSHPEQNQNETRRYRPISKPRTVLSTPWATNSSFYDTSSPISLQNCYGNHQKNLPEKTSCRSLAMLDAAPWQMLRSGGCCAVEDVAPWRILHHGGCCAVEESAQWSVSSSMLRDGAYSLAADRHHLPRR